MRVLQLISCNTGKVECQVSKWGQSLNCELRLVYFGYIVEIVLSVRIVEIVRMVEIVLSVRSVKIVPVKYATLLLT